MIELLIAIVLLIVGLALLVKGADFFVDGASSLALKFHIPPIVIGLTIVSLGTSMPELVVSTTSAIKGYTDLTLGNVTGSNLFNTLVVIGVCALIYPLKVASNTVFKEIPFSFMAVFVYTLLGVASVSHVSQVWDGGVLGYINIAGGLILLSLMVVFLYYIFAITQKHAHEKKDIYEKEAQDEFVQQPMWKTFFFIVAGLTGLVYGGQLTVDNAVILAQSWGWSEKLIGLTVIAVGTSLPELVTSVMATLKKEFDLVVGNVIGSNILNIFLIIGVTSLIKPLAFSTSHLQDNVFLAGITLVLFGSLFVFKKFTLGKVEGVALLVLYIMYTGYLIVN